MSRSVLLFLISISAMLAQTAATVAPTPIRISGRIVDSHHKPRANVSLVLEPLEAALDASSRTESKYDGTVVFEGVPRAKCKLAVPGGAFALTPSIIEPPSTGDLELGDIVVEPNAGSDISLENIHIDERALQSPLIGFFSFDSPGPNDSSSNQSACFKSFERYTSLEEFVGRGARVIRIVRVAIPPTVNDGHSQARPAIDSRELRERVLQAWTGYFKFAGCRIAWAEASIWQVEAEVEYGDSRNALLQTDGSHVHVRDRDGKHWFMRLWPAAQ